jgi:hypothetical protein
MVTFIFLDGIDIANGEVGISGSRSSPCENKTFLHAKKGGPTDSRRFHPVYVVSNFKFQISLFGAHYFSTLDMYVCIRAINKFEL